MGSVLALLSPGLVAGGGSLVWADQTQRQGGYVITRTAVFSTSGNALTGGLNMLYGGWKIPEPKIVRVQIRVTPTRRSTPAFPGQAPADKICRLLTGTGYATIRGWSGSVIAYSGAGVPKQPAAAGLWTAQLSCYGRRLPEPGPRRP